MEVLSQEAMPPTHEAAEATVDPFMVIGDPSSWQDLSISEVGIRLQALLSSTPTLRGALCSQVFDHHQAAGRVRVQGLAALAGAKQLRGGVLGCTIIL